MGLLFVFAGAPLMALSLAVYAMPCGGRLGIIRELFSG
jgi:hypothetical protein